MNAVVVWISDCSPDVSVGGGALEYDSDVQVPTGERK